MRVCDVVLNSVWWDPRVRKQIVEYKNKEVDVVAVGLKCQRYDADKVKELPCETTIVDIDAGFDGERCGILRKLYRVKMRISAVKKAIIAYNPDIIHANDLDALIPSYLASRKLGCKLVYDAHEINVENYLTDKRPRLARLMYIVEKYIVKRSDYMVCVSHAAAGYFSSEYGIQEPLVVTNCVLQSDIVNEHPGKHDKFEVLNQGQFYDGRGYDLMLDAAPLLENYPAIEVCVRGFGRLESQMRDTAKKKRLENFRFYPPVAVEELISAASYSHVGIAVTVPICLNFKLSVSNKLFEYAAAGLPVIMSDIPEHRYLNDKYKFGVILPDNTAECMADAIVKLYTDTDFYHACVEGAKRLTQDLNWENEFGKLIEIEKRMVMQSNEA